MPLRVSGTESQRTFSNEHCFNKKRLIIYCLPMLRALFWVYIPNPTLVSSVTFLTCVFCVCMNNVSNSLYKDLYKWYYNAFSCVRYHIFSVCVCVWLLRQKKEGVRNRLKRKWCRPSLSSTTLSNAHSFHNKHHPFPDYI